MFLKCTYNNLFKFMEIKFVFKNYIIFFPNFFLIMKKNFFETGSYYIFLN